MLRNVSLEDISDGKLYTANDLVKADCHDCEGCSACCCGMGESILLDPYDVFCLTGGLGKSFEELLQEHLDLHVVDGVILPNLRMAAKGDCCTFLNAEGRCSIHSFRPGICRLFPLGRYYEEGTFRYFLQDQECKKSNRSKIKVKKWLDIPGISRYESFVLDWHDFVRSRQELLTQQPDMEMAKKINLYVLELFFFQAWDAGKDFYEQFDVRLAAAKETLGRYSGGKG